MSTLSAYLSRRALYAQQLSVPVPSNLALIIVIPCYDEPDLRQTLDSLWHCAAPACSTEVLIIVNQAQDSSTAVRQRNLATLETASQWCEIHNRENFNVYPLGVFEPESQAGVGFARKVGMDEAVRRFAGINRPDGLIISLDADCEVARNYLLVLHHYQQQYPDSGACCIYFEHPVEQCADPAQAAAIASYELGLRYYRQGLQLANHPQAMHTVGSAMAVRARHYAAEGGMNRRQAGEDFYFIQKLSYQDGFRDITDTTVYPSSRRSDRTPFGTGQAVAAQLQNDAADNVTWAPQLFAELGEFFALVEDLYSEEYTLLKSRVPSNVQAFLDTQHFADHLAEIKAHVASRRRFVARFYRWFNAYRVFRYIRYATQHGVLQVPQLEAVEQMFRWLSASKPEAVNLMQWLATYRALDRSGEPGAYIGKARPPAAGQVSA